MNCLLRFLPASCAGLFAGATILLAAPAAPKVEVDFTREIRPVLADNCFKCHGPDEQARKAKLRLDVREDALRPAKSGAVAIVPGTSGKSELLRRITTTDVDDVMPPAKSGKKLTSAQLDLIRRWIEQGAKYQEHWAFAKPERPPVPKVQSSKFKVQNPIDSFVFARLEREKIVPSPEADKATLIRRVSFDLTGLPPTLAEVDAFLADTSPGAYEAVVERLLKSPRYGEHQARSWLDLARYADSNGYQYDTERSMWRWRDWVIDAFNSNLRFDQFTIQQLAGDLLPGATVSQRVATGFNRNHPITIEGGVIDEEYRTEYVMDRVNTTATVWLGLTMGCARCHDHKFDPLTMRDFYGMFAFFNQVPERGNSGFTPNVKSPTPAQERDVAVLDEQVAVKQAALAAIAKSLAPEQVKWEEATAQLKAEWHVLDATGFKSTGGATLTKQEDKSLLAGGTRAAKDDYEITARIEQTGISAVRLEALTHESLPGNGPGRFDNANFVLSEFELEIASVADPKRKEKIKFASAQADHSQQGYEILLAIDGKPATGWAVDGPTRRENRTAWFYPEKSFGYAGGTELRFKLRHDSISGHSIGRPRLSVSTSADPQAAEIAALVAVPAGKRTAQQAEKLRDYFITQHGPAEAKQLSVDLTALRDKRAKLEAAFPTTMVMQDMEERRETTMLVRGQYDKKGDVVRPGIPAVFSVSPATNVSTRLDFVRWLVSPDNPLTARVAVNRFWEQIFGTGLVKTTEDFGRQGEMPSHPELLDWLATEFVKGGWDVKALQKLMVTSAAYRQSARVTPGLLQRDPENRLLARGPRARLSAEAVRDNALALGGLLVEKVGGPSVYPYQPAGLWMELNDRKGYSKEYEPSKGEGLYRRSLYSYWKRTVPPPTLNLFDAPEREFCVVRRSRTTTPLQALALLHDPTFVEAARQFAERIVEHGGATTDGRIAFAFRTATARKPTTAEVKVLREVFEQQLAAFRKDTEAAAKSLKVGESLRNEKLDAAEHAAWTAVARMILNLDETITKS